MSIPNDIIGSANVSYLGDPFEQYCGLNGKPLIGGHIEVYLAGTSDKYMTLQDFDGDYNPFKVPLGADGRVVMLADPSLTYDIYVYNSYNDLVCSRLNVECTCPGTINLSGADTWIRNTDGTLDISLRTSANNRRVFDVNTRNKLLDVQSPLYFVENSETATVIGFSGDGYATEDKFDYDENYNITGYDGSAFARTTYSAGDYVDITDDTISVTGLQPSGNYASASDVTTLTEKLDEKLDISAFNESAVVVDKFQYEGDKITAYNNSAFAGADYEAGQYVDITDNRISVTGVQPSGNYASASDVTELNNKLADKLDTSAAFTKASADTLYQPIGEYAPTGDYAYKSDLNDYQPASSMTAYATTALVSSVSSTITGMIPTGDYELVAGEGVELVDDPNAKTTTINVTAEGTPVTAIQMMIESATSGLQPSGDYATTTDLTAKQDTLDYGYHDVAISSIDSTALYDTSAHARINTLAGRISNLSSDKLDTTAFSTVSGDFLTAHQDVSNLMPKSESANFYPMTGNPSGFLTAHQDLSNYATTASVADKLDTTAFSTVSGNFLTAVDLTPYQTTADMTAYATVESLTSKQDAGDYYSASNPSGFISEIPDTYLQNTDLATTDGKVTAISGIPLSAGGDVPEGVMVESGLEYNAVNEISGYNGSAIAQYGAEKQWLVHDDTLVHAANSAQYALGVNLSAVAQLLGVDETVLWDGSTSGTTGDVNLSEEITNFEHINIFYSMNHAYLNGAYNFGGRWMQLDSADLSITKKFNINDFGCDGTASNTMVIRSDVYTVSNDLKTFIHDIATQMFFNGTSWAVNTTQHAIVYKVIGIGRKS